MGTALRRQTELALDATTDYLGVERLAQRLLKTEFPDYVLEPRGGPTSDAGIDFLLQPKGGVSGGTIVGQVSAETSWKSRIHAWVRDMATVRPEANRLMFVTTQRILGGEIENEVERCRMSCSRSLVILDREWFVLALLQDRRLLREHLQIEADPLPMFLDPVEYGEVLARRTFSRHFGGVMSLFRGREPAIEELAEKIGESDVLLVVGPGGVGKSRFVLEASRSASSVEASGEAAWRFVRPGGEISERSLWDLPVSGRLIVVLDDAHRESNLESLRLLRSLLDSGEQGERTRLVLTTRPGHGDEVRRNLAPLAHLALEEVELLPLRRAAMNEILVAPPLSVGNEPARARIIYLARGLPSIAEAAVHVFRKGGGLGALWSEEAVWSLVEEELAHLPEGLPPDSVARLLGVLAAVPGLSMEDPAHLESLQRACRLSDGEMGRARDHFCATGLVQEGPGGALDVKPDILAESIVSHVFFPRERRGMDFVGEVWKPFGQRHGRAILERVADVAAGGQSEDAVRFLQEALAGLAGTIPGASNAERRRSLEICSGVAHAVPDLVLQVARRVLEAPAPDHEESPFGFTVPHTHTGVVDEVVGVLEKVFLQGWGPQAREAMELLLMAVEQSARPAEDGAGPPGVGGRATELLRRLVAPGWGWIPGGRPDLDAARERLRTLADWFRQEPAHRAGLCARLLKHAADPRLDITYVSAESKGTWKMAFADIGSAPGLDEYYEDFFGLILKVVAAGGPKAQMRAMEALTSLARDSVIRRSGLHPPLDPQLQDLLYERLEESFGRLLEMPAEIAMPARQELFEGTLAFLRNSSRGLGPEGSRLFEALRTLPERRLYKHMVGGNTSYDADGNYETTDPEAWEESWKEAISGYVEKAAGSIEALDSFLDEVAAVCRPAAECGEGPGIAPGEILFMVAERSPELGVRAGRLIAREHMSVLNSALPWVLRALWRNAPEEARDLSRKLLEGGAPAHREAVAHAALSADPGEEQWALAMELAREGPEGVWSVLANAVRWTGESDPERSFDLVLEVGQRCGRDLLAKLVEWLGAPGASGERRRARWTVPAGREDNYLDLLARLLEAPRFPWDGIGLADAFRALARLDPAGLVGSIERRLERARAGEEVDPVPKCLLSALGEMPGGQERDGMASRWEDMLRRGEETWHAGKILVALLTHEERAVRCRELVEEDPRRNMLVIRELLPRMPRDIFQELLAVLVRRLYPEAREELIGMVHEHAMPSGTFGTGRISPRYDRTRKEFEEWRKAGEAALRDFGKEAVEHLRERVRAHRRREEDEYEW